MNEALELRSLLRTAVAEATTPRTGLLLSGGIDSATITALADPNLPTFTGYYDGEQYDERRYALLAGNGRFNHHIIITPNDFVRHIDECLSCLEPPFQGPGTFGQWMVARYAAKHVDRVLSGEGGDELFGGYARLLIVAGKPRPDGYDDYQVPLDYPDTVEEALQYDWAKLADLLAVDGQVTGAHGLEAVAPMLNPDVVSFVLALPAELRVGKVLLRTAMRGLVPHQILERTDKRGFPVPFVAWAQEEPVRSYLKERIGYVPNPARPWDRCWWYDLCERTLGLAA